MKVLEVLNRSQWLFLLFVSRTENVSNVLILSVNRRGVSKMLDRLANAWAKSKSYTNLQFGKIKFDHVFLIIFVVPSGFRG